MTRWLKHRTDGTIYEWHEYLVDNPLVVEVTEEEAFPENFVPAKQRGRKSQLDLVTDEPEPAHVVPPETEAEASKIPHPRAKSI